MKLRLTIDRFLYSFVIWNTVDSSAAIAYGLP
jgi:hypothetical protein